MAVANQGYVDSRRPTLPGTLACQAMSRPAATNPTLLKVLAGCRMSPVPASQKFAPRPTSGPSQPRRDGDGQQAARDDRSRRRNKDRDVRMGSR
jgi:hypothetical protein